MVRRRAKTPQLKEAKFHAARIKLMIQMDERGSKAWWRHWRRRAARKGRARGAQFVRV